MAAELGEVVDEQRARLRKDVLESQVVELHEFRALDDPCDDGRHVRIVPDMVEPEHEIVRGKRYAVGPLDAGTQADGRDVAIRA